MLVREFSLGTVTAMMKSFSPQGRTAEHHIMLHLSPESSELSRDLQIEELEKAGRHILTEIIPTASAVLQRYFLKDSTSADCPEGAIGQRPLDGSEAAAWIYAVEPDTQCGDFSSDSLSCSGHVRTFFHNGRKHIWQTGMCVPEGDSAEQTSALLEGFEGQLSQEGANIADNCIRTWFFVDDIDHNYAGMVRARKDNFDRNGLTLDTHYISSTGICGKPHKAGSTVQMDTYSIIPAPAVRFLYASDNMNRTSDYGVTFERGTLVPYGDRSHIFISGTASIDNKGLVLHEGDVEKQAGRMLENVELLLKEGGASFDDVMQIIVYLRNAEDYSKVADIFKNRFPDIPTVIVLAPVCRPEWLVEMECIAITESGEKCISDF